MTCFSEVPPRRRGAPSRWISKALLGFVVVISGRPGGAATAGDPSPQLFDRPVSEAVDYLLEHNRDYRKNLADWEKARMDVLEASSSALPQVQLDFSGTYLGNVQTFENPFEADSAGAPTGPTELLTSAEKNYKGSFSVSQLLFSGSVFNAIGVSRSYRRVSESSLRQRRITLTRDFLADYSRLDMLRDLVALNREIVEQTKARFEDAGLLHEIGSLSRYDLLRSEVEYMNSIPALREAEDGLGQAEAGLRLMLNLPAGTKIVIHGFDLDSPALDPSSLPPLNGGAAAPGDASSTDADDALDRYSARALELRPEPRMAEHAVEGYRKAVKVYKASRWPTLAAFYNYERANQWDLFQQDDVWRNSWNAGLSLSIPVFTGFLAHSKIRKGAADLDKAVQDLSTLRDAIRLEVDMALDELQRRRLDFAAWERNVEAAQEGLRIAEMRRESGSGSELELRDARTAMKAARVNLAQARFELQRARIELLHATGDLDSVRIIDN